jgi:ribosomal protein S14
MSIHVYSARCQPATHFVDHFMPRKPLHFRYPARHVFRCDVCGRLRWAKNLSVQVYYDMRRIFCTETEVYRGNRRCKRTVNTPALGG